MWLARDEMSQWTSLRVNLAARVRDAEVVASSAYTYDDAGRTTSVVRTGPGGSEANYAYTSAGRLSGASWSTGLSVAYSYNSVGELTEVVPSGTGSVPTVDYGYDPSGRVSWVSRQGQAGPVPTSSVDTYAEYDPAGQLALLVHYTDDADLELYDITRDVRGNPIQVDTTTDEGTTSALYSYDKVSRLKKECYPTSGDACTGKSPKMSYTYDKVGNCIAPGLLEARECPLPVGGGGVL